MLRELTIEELGYVSGGLVPPPPPEDEIIVNGVRLQSTTLSDDLWSYGGVNEDYAGMYGQNIVPVWVGILIAEFLIALAILAIDKMTDDEKADAERDIAAKFGNTNVVKVQTTTEGDKLYTAADGWTYADVDGNGKLDVRFRNNSDGSSSLDTGSGVIVSPR